MAPSDTTAETTTATATLGGGCFWCMEALYKLLPGVVSVESGYAGGHVLNPNYRQVCSGTTGHAEVVRITFDPAVVTFAELLDFFWIAHDPTTLNRQGNDVGTQYRSVIFYQDDEQKKIALHAKSAAEVSGLFSSPIVTQIAPLQNYYAAEDYHKDYFANHPEQAYCTYVIRPKVDKIRKLRTL